MSEPYKIADILNLKDPMFDDWGISRFSDFMKKDVKGYMIKRSHEVRCFMLAKKIIKAFWECVMEDFFENDTVLVISKRPRIEIKISYLSNFNSSKYYYYKKTNGRYYKVFVIVGDVLSDKLNCYFFTESTHNFKKELMKRIDNNYTWSQF